MIRPVPVRSWPRAPALFVLLALAACSTAKPEEQDQYCDDQSDCAEGEVCSDNICYPNVLPERETIALDVRSDGFSSSPFRVEILGEDVAVERILDRLPLRYFVERPAVRDRLRLSLRELRTLTAPGEDTTGTPAATADLQQASRLGRVPLRFSGLNFPLPDPAAMPPAIPSILVPWPHYDPADAASANPLVLDIFYQDDLPGGQPDLPLWTRGVVSRQLVRKVVDGAADHEFVIGSVRECHRKLSGLLRFPEGPPPDPGLPPEMPPTIGITMRHAGRPDDGDPATPICDPAPPDGTPATCSPATLLGQTYTECQTDNQCPEPLGCHPDPVDDVKRCGCWLDSECPKGQVCNVELQQCALDLTDRPAIRQVNVEYKDGAGLSTSVYTYCEEDREADRTMEFVVTAAPDIRLGLPRLSYRVVLDFLFSDVATYLTPTPKYTGLKAICLPTWEPAQTIQFALTGVPTVVYSDDTSDQSWTCCDTTCLNSPAGPAPQSCKIKAAVGATGTFAIADPVLWDSMSCMQLLGTDDEGKVRATYPSGSCQPNMDTCTIGLSPGRVGGGGQTYSLRIEPPVGSVFRSTIVDVQVQKGVTEVPIDPLARRVLLRGAVEVHGCDVDDCFPVAEILAERVIRGEDPATLLGPYLFSGSTFSATSGKYVLPVDPGVYLVTALPKTSVFKSNMGPAPIIVLDLREGSPLLVEEDGVLVADIDPLIMRPSPVYTMELDEFDTSSRVIPLDLATWVGLGHPDGGDPLDLNAPGTCLPAEGCQIRRLRAGNSPVRLAQDQQIRFVARAPATAE